MTSTGEIPALQGPDCEGGGAPTFAVVTPEVSRWMSRYHQGAPSRGSTFGLLLRIVEARCPGWLLTLSFAGKLPVLSFVDELTSVPYERVLGLLSREQGFQLQGPAAFLTIDLPLGEGHPGASPTSHARTTERRSTLDTQCVQDDVLRGGSHRLWLGETCHLPYLRRITPALSCVILEASCEDGGYQRVVVAEEVLGWVYRTLLNVIVLPTAHDMARQFAYVIESRSPGWMMWEAALLRPHAWEPVPFHMRYVENIAPTKRLIGSYRNTPMLSLFPLDTALPGACPALDAYVESYRYDAWGDWSSYQLLCREAVYPPMGDVCRTIAQWRDQDRLTQLIAYYEQVGNEQMRRDIMREYGIV